MMLCFTKTCWRSIVNVSIFIVSFIAVKFFRKFVIIHILRFYILTTSNCHIALSQVFLFLCDLNTYILAFLLYFLKRTQNVVL